MRGPTPPAGERSPRPRPRPPRRCKSAESLSIIPTVLSVDSEFQTILGKSLFEKTVNGAEDDLMAKGDSVIKWSDRPASTLGASRSGDTNFSTAASPKPSGPPVFEYRTAISVRPTLSTSPLVKQNQTFASYFPKGSLDHHTVAHSHGRVDGPYPSITRQVHRLRSASHVNLRSFSLKPDLTDRKKETAREIYWKRRAQLKVLEECIRQDVIDEVMALADAEIARREEQRAAARLVQLEKLAELERLELERIRLEQERLARLIENGAQTTITYIEDIKNAEKAPVKGKKKGKKGRGKKSSSPSRGGGAKSPKTAKKKKKKSPSVGADDDNQTLPQKTVTSILKAEERLGSASSLSSGDSAKKRVSFRKKLTSTRTIRSNSPPKRSSSPTPGGKKRGAGGKRGKGKKGKAKVSPEPIPVEPVAPVEPPPPPPEPEPEPPVEPSEPIVIQLDDPPEFIPAEEYRTKNQLVQDWLTYKTSKSASKTLPLLIDL